MTISEIQLLLIGAILGIIASRIADELLTFYNLARNKTRVIAKINVVRHTANIHIRGPLDSVLDNMAHLLRAFKYEESEEGSWLREDEIDGNNSS